MPYHHTAMLGSTIYSVLLMMIWASNMAQCEQVVFLSFLFVVECIWYHAAKSWLVFLGCVVPSGLIGKWQHTIVLVFHFSADWARTSPTLWLISSFEKKLYLFTTLLALHAQFDSMNAAITRCPPPTFHHSLVRNFHCYLHYSCIMGIIIRSICWRPATTNRLYTGT